MNPLKKLTLLGLLLATASLTGCVTKRTTTSNGAVTDEKYVVKRPIKKFINNVEFE
ncbi:MAG: hypothetical protein ACI9E1_000170 [Cryomorphaceae bacterium]|jgi:hypothetical protein